MNAGRAVLQGMLLLDAAILTAILAWGPAPVLAAPLAGTWRQTLHSQSYRLAPSWSNEFCPPRPPDRQIARVREFRLDTDGDRYTLRSGREVFGSHDCLSENPAVKLQGYDPAARLTRCATPETLGTHEVDSHRLVLRGEDALEIEGEYHFFWKLKGHMCEAWMTELRRFERVAVPEPAEPAPTSEQPEAIPPPPQAEQPRAPEPPAQPEPLPAELPLRKTRPGQEPGAQALAEPRAAPRPRASARADIELPRDERARQDVRQQRGGAAFQRRQSGNVESPASGNAWLLFLLAALAASAVAVLPFVLQRRSRQGQPPDQPVLEEGELIFFHPEEPEPGRNELPVAQSLVKERPAVPPGIVCPRCGTELPPDARFCPFDATPLAASDAASSGQAQQALASRSPLDLRVCPRCQRQYAGALDTCPADGAPLVAILCEARETASVRTGQAFKVCPLCDARYAPEVSFCGRDGTPLVLRKE